MGQITCTFTEGKMKPTTKTIYKQIYSSYNLDYFMLVNKSSIT